MSFRPLVQMVPHYANFIIPWPSLGRRLRKEDDEDEANVIGDAMNRVNDLDDIDDDIPW
jgi:hypothetical protein